MSLILLIAICLHLIYIIFQNSIPLSYPESLYLLSLYSPPPPPPPPSPAPLPTACFIHFVSHPPPPIRRFNHHPIFLLSVWGLELILFIFYFIFFPFGMILKFPLHPLSLNSFIELKNVPSISGFSYCKINLCQVTFQALTT
ncbi:hypothetical protein SO802_030419 [Lithocarpus litseifolius]|uniref:Uncharacterized protein n=1 Tax=Lithocarpus litseifolius TaxID=425828 RepID=A0AAW2BJ76_9ROSI